MVDYNQIIKKLNLQPLSVEGGYFNKIITLKDKNKMQLGSCIYYLITETSFSSLHKVLKDEIWYFLEGDPLIQIQFCEASNCYTEVEIGKVSDNFNAVSLVEKDVWQATKLKDGGSWALVATTVIPGFGENDFKTYDDLILEKLNNFCDVKNFIY
jgi:predicted cupin superfamily sugar epimerase